MPRVSARKRLNRRKQSSTSTKPRRAPRIEQPRRQWTDVQMEAAMKAAEDGSPINQAAREHGVPKTTLRDSLSGRVTHGSKPGVMPYVESRPGDVNCTSGGTPLINDIRPARRDNVRPAPRPPSGRYDLYKYSTILLYIKRQ